MSTVAIEVQGAPVNGYLAVPDSGSGPGVLVIQEWWGLVPHIRSVVERLAESGFVAMAVDHYRGVETTEPDEAQKLMMGMHVDAIAFYPAMPWPDYHPHWTHYAGKAAIIHKAESDEAHAGPRIAEYAEAIGAAGGKASIFDYPGSEHAFFNDDRPEVYHAEYAQAAWQRSIDFFDARLR
ncbi:MAG TPA: dienelactone hydrolase family protein [Candidatus Nanopelagicales bacterium]|nr:dienelactone hydrolase family protein [Candidatus Nanopelagicales bacterium]